MILIYFTWNPFSFVALPGDVEVMVRMKETIDSQRDELRQLNGEVQSQKREVDAVSILSLYLLIQIRIFRMEIQLLVPNSLH